MAPSSAAWVSAVAELVQPSWPAGVVGGGVFEIRRRAGRTAGPRSAAEGVRRDGAAIRPAGGRWPGRARDARLLPRRGRTPPRSPAERARTGHPRPDRWACAAASASEAEFVRRLKSAGLAPRPRYGWPDRGHRLLRRARRRRHRRRADPVRRRPPGRRPDPAPPPPALDHHDPARRPGGRHDETRRPFRRQIPARHGRRI